MWCVQHGGASLSKDEMLRTFSLKKHFLVNVAGGIAGIVAGMQQCLMKISIGLPAIGLDILHLLQCKENKIKKNMFHSRKPQEGRAWTDKNINVFNKQIFTGRWQINQWKRWITIKLFIVIDCLKVKFVNIFFSEKNVGQYKKRWNLVTIFIKKF